METIFHEKQEGALCAQHCLNNLLQGAYFSAVDLAAIAQDLDEAERKTMAEGGGQSSVDYLNFIQEPSSNMDDSGYFSIQVLSRALAIWGLDMISYNSKSAESARMFPMSEQAYICNQQNHWLTIRKLGSQWFNLNSIKAIPELISDTYLSLLLAQLQTDGYLIFVIKGVLPDSEAEELLKVRGRISKSEYDSFDTKQRLLNQEKFQKERLTDHEAHSSNQETLKNTAAIEVKVEDVRSKRLKFFQAEKTTEKSDTDLTEEEMLQKAIELSYTSFETEEVNNTDTAK